MKTSLGPNVFELHSHTELYRAIITDTRILGDCYDEEKQ